MSTLKEYLYEAISSGKWKYDLDITFAHTTIPELERYLNYLGFTKMDYKQYSSKNYTVVKFVKEPYIDIVNPESDAYTEFTVWFGNPKRSGRLTMTRVQKFIKGDPFGEVSSPEELYEYINY